MANRKLIVPPTYRAGLELEWVSPGTNTSQLRVKSGEAFVPGYQGILEVPNPITPPVGAFDASSFYYAYLYNSGTTASPVAAVELVKHSTSPDTRPTVYRGHAKIKGTDNTRRYLGSVRTNADSMPRMWNFQDDGRIVKYREAVLQLPFAVWNASPAAANTEYTVSCGAIVPPTSRRVDLALIVGAANLSFGTSDDSIGAMTSGTFGMGIYSGSSWQSAHGVLLNASQQFIFQVSAAATPILSVMAYHDPR